jgi:hypothetical protein
VIWWALWRRGLLQRANREKIGFFLGLAPDPLQLSRRYPLWRSLGVFRLLFSPAYAAGVARWMEYRMNLFDGIEG